MVPSISRREWEWVIKASLIIVALAVIPYIVAGWVTPEGYRFSGLLVNPIDGHSYIAKMGQGAVGSWLFRLPYTAESHQPAFIYPYYLLLGHLVPGGSPTTLVIVYHIVRSCVGFILLLTIYFAASIFDERLAVRRWTLLLSGLASGFGWLFGGGADLTVPEANTFASLLVNAHFGFTNLLFLLLILNLTILPSRGRGLVVIGFCAVWLTWVQPILVPLVAATAGTWSVIESTRGKEVKASLLVRGPAFWQNWGRLLLFMGIATPFLLYDLWLMNQNPVFARWMAQNITPSPPLWEWMVAYGLTGVLAVVGAIGMGKRSTPANRLLLTWGLWQMVFIALPISLQRRMSTGFHLVVCLLAVKGLWSGVIPQLHGRWRRLVPVALLAISFPSNLFIMLAGVNSAATANPLVVISEPEWKALVWMRDSLPAENIVLANEEMSVLIPAWGGGARVVYGHPFETPDAKLLRTLVIDYLAGRLTVAEQTSLLNNYGVTCLIIQEDEPKAPIPADFNLVWYSGPVSIYERTIR